jgi:hypothetical protein
LIWSIQLNKIPGKQLNIGVYYDRIDASKSANTQALNWKTNHFSQGQYYHFTRTSDQRIIDTIE